MNAVDGMNFGKHGTVKDRADFYRVLGMPKDRQTVEVFDEEPGLVFLYVGDGKSRYFARSVDSTNLEHFNDVMGAWASSRKMIDCRTDKTIPIPGL